MARISGLPQGVGIGLRKPHYNALPTISRRLDWLEFVAENFVGVGGRLRSSFDKCRAQYSMLAHGVSISIGGPDPFDADYIASLKRLLDEAEVPIYTDHLCYASAGGLALHELLPLPFTEEAVRHVAARVRELADRLERPIALENISFYSVMPGSELDEAAFVSAVLEESDAYLLLDVNNVYVNAVNHDRDAGKWLEALPLSRTVQIHVAGHVKDGERLLDNHGRPVKDEVWALLEHALRKVGPVPVLLEWDSDIPALDRVLDEADRAREVYDAVFPEGTPS